MKAVLQQAIGAMIVDGLALAISVNIVGVMA